MNPRSIEWWENFLGRDVNPNERSIIDDYSDECSMNESIKEILKFGKAEKLSVKLLTKVDGNCLFESLVSHNIGPDIMTLRSGLATLMYYVKDIRGFLGENSDSIQEMFDLTNEIEEVGKLVNNEFVSLHKYNFDVMIQDMTVNCSWEFLPSQIILMLVSKLYNVKIVIINNQSSYRNVIDISGKENPKTIYIGHINEFHYIPLTVDNDVDNDDEMYEYLDSTQQYTDTKVIYKKWLSKIFRDRIGAVRKS